MSGLFYFVRECVLSANVFVRELRELCELKKKKLI